MWMENKNHTFSFNIYWINLQICIKQETAFYYSLFSPFCLVSFFYYTESTKVLFAQSPWLGHKWPWNWMAVESDVYKLVSQVC